MVIPKYIDKTDDFLIDYDIVGIQIPPGTEWGSYVSCVLIILQLFPWFDDLMENPSTDSLAHYIKECLKQEVLII